MKKLFLFLFFAGILNGAMSQQKLYINHTNHLSEGVWLTAIDSMYFNANGSEGYFIINQHKYTYQTASIDSLTFGNDTLEIVITFNGTKVSVVNPLAFEGVTVTLDGCHVTVNSTTDTRDISYRLSGTTANGSFKIYSAKRFNLLLDGADIINPYGPAINIQSNIKAFVNVVDGTNNSLSDGNKYDDAPLNADGDNEDQKAVFFSEGKLEFNGTGTLTINGLTDDKHALCSDDEIDINEGTIIIASASKDGIHAKSGFRATGGTIKVNAVGDAIDGDEGYIKITNGSITAVSTGLGSSTMACDSFLLVSGGVINLSVSGNQSKGMKVKQGTRLMGGTITINTSGAAVLEASGSGYDVSYCTAIKCDSTITINGAQITLVASGAAGRGITSGLDINFISGNMAVTSSGNGATYTNSSGTKDAYASVCMKADGNVTILDGTITLTNSGSAGKGLVTGGNLTIGDEGYSPTINITTTGSKIIISTSGQGPNANTVAAEAKAISSDGAVTVNSGVLTISSNDDGIKSTSAVTINGGNVNLTKSVEGIESPSITVNDGTVNIVASDDGFNATYGNGGENNDGSLLTLKGGSISVNVSGGDGLDSNGSIVVSGGTIVVHGPQSQPEVGMDYNGTCNVSGGLLVVSGVNSNMTQAISTTSAQYGLKLSTSQTIVANTIIHIQDATGNSVLTFKPVRSYSSIVFTSPQLVNGTTYYIYTGGSSTGTNNNGLYTDGTYSGGTPKKSFTLSSKVTSVTF